MGYQNKRIKIKVLLCLISSNCKNFYDDFSIGTKHSLESHNNSTVMKGLTRCLTYVTDSVSVVK